MHTPADVRDGGAVDQTGRVEHIREGGGDAGQGLQVCEEM